MINNYLSKTAKFLGRPYAIGNPKNKTLQVGDICMVMPTSKSQSKKPYEVQIIHEYINWGYGPSVEICTSLNSIFEKGHSAVLNEYLFSRLKPVL